MIRPVNRINLLIGYTRVQGNFTQFFVDHPSVKSTALYLRMKGSTLPNKYVFRELESYTGWEDWILYLLNMLPSGPGVFERVWALRICFSPVQRWHFQKSICICNLSFLEMPDVALRWSIKIKINDNFLFNSLAARSAFCPKLVQNFSWF